MRPRRIRRGELVVQELEVDTIKALQCGHDEFAVENVRPGRSVGHGRCASMRLLRIRGGKLCLWCWWTTSLTASMRPRRIRRGERQSPDVLLPPGERLQCGHDEFAVENSLCGMLGRLCLYQLQCGHDEF